MKTFAIKTLVSAAVLFGGFNTLKAAGHVSPKPVVHPVSSLPAKPIQPVQPIGPIVPVNPVQPPHFPVQPTQPPTVPVGPNKPLPPGGPPSVPPTIPPPPTPTPTPVPPTHCPNPPHYGCGPMWFWPGFPSYGSYPISPYVGNPVVFDLFAMFGTGFGF